MAVIPSRSPGARIDRVCLTVPDLARAAGFYRDALRFTHAGPAAPCNPDRATLLGLPGAALQAQTMRLGGQTLELLAFDQPGEPYPADGTASDLWFQHCAIVVGDMAAATAGLGDIRPITQGGPQVLPPNTGGVTAFKFRDPFGHPLELLAFPNGVGDPVWHEPGAGVIRGIDHTAIAVADAERSARFYEALLGFRVTARSSNEGPAQSRLDAIANVTVDVVALGGDKAPPHLELLGYHAGLRRPRPAEWSPRHQALTRTIIFVDDLAAVGARVPPLAESRPVRHGTWDGAPALALDDPDGHSLIIRAPA